MSSLIDQIASMDNLMLAWRKIENLFIPGDIWFDPLKLAAFKYCLKENLKAIRKDLLEGTYILHKIVPVPFPKKNKEDVETIRQSFIIDVSDQLVWVAVCNVIGVYLDSKMPAWSYGNRLYLYWWKDKADKWQIGNYRNSTPVLYRNWNQSWPQMKRKITVSLKKMAFAEDAELDADELSVLDQEERIDYSYAKLKYLKANYFSAFSGKKTDTLYWIGLDLTKFYTRVNIKKVVEIIIRELGNKADERLNKLLKTITDFEIDSKDYRRPNYEEGLHLMDLSLDEISYSGLPTGLLVAGFLANVYMLDVDREADKYLDKHHDVIHFRYVDDHVIIGRSVFALKNWVDNYLGLLKGVNLEINIEKTEPRDVIQRDDLGVISVNADLLQKKGSIDAFYPTPLMTQTLQKVSMLSREKLPLLSASEFNLVFKDLQTMLVTDIPETEIKKATRISFACTLLSRMMRNGSIDYHEVYRSRRGLYDMFVEKEGIIDSRRKELRSLLFKGGLSLTKDELNKLNPEEREVFGHLRSVIKEGDENSKVLAKTIFCLLMRSLNEVPDKVKIWVRTFLFAVNHYPEGIKVLCDGLERIKTKKVLHPLSALYLKSIIEFLSADSILDIIKHLYINDYSIDQDRERDVRALKYLLSINYEDEGMGFKRVSSLVLRHAKATYQIHCGHLGLVPLDCDIPISVSFKYEDGLNIDTTFWALWKLENLDERKENADLVSKRMLSKEKIDSHSPFFEAFVFRMLSSVDVTDKEGLNVFPVIDNLENISNELKYALWMSEVGRKICAMERPVPRLSNNWWSVYDWISSCNASLRKTVRNGICADSLRDTNRVTYSEVLSVKLMIAIVEKVKEVLGEESIWNDQCLHPLNIMFDRKTLKNIDWYKVLDDVPLRIKLVNREIEGADHYYSLCQSRSCELPVFYSVCYGLGLIFLHLLTRELYFPWIMNNPNYGYEWRRELNRMLNKGEVSSINYKIVEACLSMWNRETIYLMTTLGEPLFRHDESDQTMIIRGIDDLLDVLKESFKQMKDNVISVPEGQFRQLIEITVD